MVVYEKDYILKQSDKLYGRSRGKSYWNTRLKLHVSEKINSVRHSSSWRLPGSTMGN